MVEAFGGNSPVIVVINKIDENPGYDLNRNYLMKKYKNILGFMRISCYTGSGIDKLSELLVNSFGKVDHLKTLWPKSWLDLKELIEKKTDNYISLSEYHKISIQTGVENEQREVLLDFLHDLGVILRFNEFHLKATNVLNPHWVTEGVYKIINSKILSDNFGMLKIFDLDRILSSEYPVEKYMYLISLMKKFELCYSIDDDSVLVPDLLPVEEPEHEFQGDLRIVFKFSFLPRSVIARFIVQMHNDIGIKNHWRTGAILENEEFKSKAMFRADFEEKNILIEVNGGQKRDYYAVLRHTILDLTNDFENINFEERIYIQDSSNTVSYNHLVNLEEAGVSEFIPEGMTQKMNVKQLLGSVIKTEKEKVLEQEILDILLELKEKYNEKSTVISEANKIIELKPNIAGIGINLNYLIDKIFNK